MFETTNQISQAEHLKISRAILHWVPSAQALHTALVDSSAGSSPAMAKNAGERQLGGLANTNDYYSQLGDNQWDLLWMGFHGGRVMLDFRITIITVMFWFNGIYLDFI